MAVKVVQANGDGTTVTRTARDSAHAQRMTDRIKAANPTAKVTTK